MEEKTDGLYPSALLENIDLEQGLEKKMILTTVLITILITLKKWSQISKIKTIIKKNI